MGESDDPGPIVEPLIQTDTFATEAVVETIEGNVRITALAEVENERRVVGRVVLPADKARQLVADLRRVLLKGGN